MYIKSYSQADDGTSGFEASTMLTDVNIYITPQHVKIVWWLLSQTWMSLWKLEQIVCIPEMYWPQSLCMISQCITSSSSSQLRASIAAKTLHNFVLKYTTYVGRNLRHQVIESRGHGKIPLLAHQSTNGVNPSSGPTLNPWEYQNFAACNLQIGLVDCASKDGPTVYGVSSVSRIDKVESLFCKRAL